jgi:uncharacterized protein (DUF3084 family)
VTIFTPTQELHGVAHPDLTTVMLSLFGGGALTTFGAAILNSFRKPSSQTELIQVATEAAKSVIHELRTDVDAVRDDLREVRAEHEECRIALAKGERERAELKVQLDDLMHDRVALPGERDLFL